MDYESRVSSKAAVGLETVFKKLAAKDTEDSLRVELWYELLDVLRYVGKRDLSLEKCDWDSVCDNLLERLLISISLTDDLDLGVGVDLFGYVFAYCSVFPNLQQIVIRFIKKLDDSGLLRQLLWKVCCSSKNGNGDQELQGAVSVTTNKNNKNTCSIGLYDVVFQLEAFEKLDESVWKFLDLNLGVVLIKNWIPSWKSWISPFRDQGKYFNPITFLLNERLLIKLVNDYELDIAIANFQAFPEKWEAFSKHDMGAVQYFMLKCARRAVKYSRLITAEFFLQVTEFFSKTMKDDKFQLIARDHSGTIHFQIIMEFIDHPKLNLLEESHLALLLRSSLDHILGQCLIHNHIPRLHSTLGKLGTTQSLPSLINLLQYTLSRYCLKIIECAQNGVDMEDMPHWYKKMTNLYVPSWFEEFRPLVPPISKGLFGDGENSIELEEESHSFRENFKNIFESLQLTVTLNEQILKFYGEIDLNPFKLNSETISSTVKNIQSITTSKYFKMYYVPLFTTLLISDQLLLNDGDNFQTFLDDSTKAIGAKRLFRHCVKQSEHLIHNYGNIGLYHFVMFLSQISVESLLLQKLSIKLLNHLFFQGDKQWVLQLCLSNELTLQSLHDYILLWNDGSESYSSFFTEVFKKPQPTIEMKSVVIGDFVELLTDEKYYNQNKSKNVINKPKTKYNTNASAFVPNDLTSLHMHTPKRSEYSQQQYPLNPSPNIYGFSNTRGFEANKITGSNNNTTNNTGSNNHTHNHANSNNSIIPTSKKIPLSDCYSTLFSSEQPTRSHAAQSWPLSPSIPQQDNTAAIRLVNTGKSYILGGHNRAVNNSRTKSVHVDDFEQSR